MLIINGLKLNYRYNKGEKEVLLFLHGWGGSLKSFEVLENYFAQLKYSTINLDFFGFGKSDEPPASFTIYQYAFAIKQMLDNLKIKKVSIISHSFGSRVAIILSAIYNEIVNKLVIIDGAGLKPKFNLKTFIKIKRFKFLKFLSKYKLYKKENLNNYGSEDYKNLSDNMKHVFIKVVNEDLFKLLPKITASTLLIWGKKDKSTPLYMAKIFNKHIKNSGLVIYDNCGHFSYLEELRKTEIILKTFFEGD